MKHILFAALLLGICLPTITAQGQSLNSRVFEFTDDNGLCWRCYPGASCERCAPTSPNRRAPPEWSTTCPEPGCTPENRGFIFPSPTLRKYFQCELNEATGEWVVITQECPCDTLFDYATQTCREAWDFIPFCDFNLPNTDPTVIDCNPRTTTPGPDDTTTVSNGEDTTTTAVDATTSAPCVCVIWWPCWCNPCMRMPRPPSCMMMG